MAIRKYLRYFIRDKKSGLYMFGTWSWDEFDLIPFESISQKLPDLFTLEEVENLKEVKEDVEGLENFDFQAIPVFITVNEDESYDL